MHRYEVLASRRVFDGRVLAVRSDQVAMPGEAVSQRDVVELPGAVGIVALDADERVLLVRQYRHPVGRHLWEIPAGLLDSTTESALEAGQRELAEEGFVTAGRWDCLCDILTSPGMTDETIRLLLARDLADVPVGERHVAFHEEADMELTRVPLVDAVARVLSGEIENGITVAGLLAAFASLRGGPALRAVDAEWAARKGGQSSG